MICSEPFIQCKQANAHTSTHLGVVTHNKDFGTPLAFGIMVLPRFMPLSPTFTVKEVLKIYIYIFFTIM